MALFPGARPKRAEVMYRQTQVVQLASARLDYDQIAAELGYANRSGEWKAHQRARAAHQAETVEEHLALEVARLDALQERLWDKAMTGDVRSVTEIRRIIEQRCRLLGLAAGKPGRKPEGPTSVVLPSFWEHMGANHPEDWRVCRCPEIVWESVDEGEFRWPG